jgi:uncharacterized membrane protein YeaQ/YmgE (transglycosylase-associated protein family)
MPESSMLDWLLIGVVLGVVLRMLMPRRDPGGFVVAILVGIVGAILGGAIAQMLGWRLDEGWGNDIAAASGAVILLIAYRLIVARRAG